MFKRLIRRPAVQVALAWGVATYLRFVLGTTRWRFEGREHVMVARGRTVVAFWHEALPLMPRLFGLARRDVPLLLVRFVLYRALSV